MMIIAGTQTAGCESRSQKRRPISPDPSEEDELDDPLKPPLLLRLECHQPARASTFCTEVKRIPETRNTPRNPTSIFFVIAKERVRITFY